MLTPGGLFVGSTSQLEPYHAWSLWNYTIYGFQTIVEDAGLTLEEVRPGIDGIALVQRHWFGRKKEQGGASRCGASSAQWGCCVEVERSGRDEVARREVS